MDDKLAKAIEFIKLLRWQYPLPSKLSEIDKFVFECEKEVAQQGVQPTVESGGILPAPRNIKSEVMLLAKSG